MRDSFLGSTVHCHHKGGNSAQEMSKANALSTQQLQIMQSQLAQQKAQLAMVNPSIQSIIQNGGMLPAQQAAMTSAAMAQTGQQENQAIGSINQNLVARGLTGGDMAGGGGVAQNFGALQQGLLGQQAQNLQNIQMAKGQGLQNAIGLGLGEGQMFGQQALGFGSQGVSSLGIGQQAAGQADANQTGFWGSLVGGLAGMGGSYLGRPQGGCWVAAELYGGWYSDEAMTIRAWLAQTWWMRPFVIVYSHTAWRWRGLIRRNLKLRKASKRLFDLFLRLAHAGR
jgi:hypothetical protein